MAAHFPVQGTLRPSRFYQKSGYSNIESIKRRIGKEKNIFPHTALLNTQERLFNVLPAIAEQSAFVMQFFMSLSYGFTLTKHVSRALFSYFIYLAIVCLFAFGEKNFFGILCVRLLIC